MICSRALLLLALAPVVMAADLQLPTAFEVRRDLTELLSDLAKAGPGDEGPLLERASGLLERHGGELVETPDGGRTVAATITEALAQAHLDRRYIELYAGRADVAEAQAVEIPALERVALAYPGTPAARRAWKRLADRAWDHGQPGAALNALRFSGTTEAERQVAAGRLAQPSPEPAAPSHLKSLTRAWALTINQRATTPAAALAIRRRRDATQAPLRTVLARPLGEVTALSDGLRLTVIDHLLGNIQGESLTLGDTPLPLASCRPAPLEDGWIALGLQEQRLRLVRCDRAGGLRWRATSPDLGFGITASAPVIIDGVVVVVAQASDGEAAEMRAMAWHLSDGKPAWNVMIGRAGGARGWGGPADDRRRPLLTVHDGALLALGDVGRVIRISSSGRVERIWSYRADTPEPSLDEAEKTRSGALVSDGQWAVASPADAPGLLLLIDGAKDPKPYRGDGAAGEVLALSDGTAWLGGNRLIALDLLQAKARWDAPLAATSVQPGPDHVLVVTAGQVATVTRDQGIITDHWTTPQPMAVVAADGWLITASQAPATQDSPNSLLVSAWGDPGPAKARLTASAAAGSWNAAAALASLSASTQQPAEAIQWSMTALRLGAPAEYARKTANLLRRRLEHPANPEQASSDLALLADLTARDASLAGEFAYWQALLATDPATRAAALARAQAAPPSLFEGPGGVGVDIRLLAAARAGTFPTWLPTPEAAPVPGSPWSRAGRRAPGSLVAANRLFSYMDGVLVAYHLTTGQELWWRRPGRPLLGVQSGDGRGEGVALAQVLPGSSAAAAGLQSGDVLLRLNDREMRSFTGDLMPTVLALGVRGSFTAVVRRGTTDITCKGTLGGELVAPVAADANTVLVWPTGLARGNGRVVTASPEGLWVEALDAVTGTRRWRQAIAPATSDGLPARPLLIQGLVVLPDGPDLIAREAVSGAERWRLPAAADRLGQARIVGSLLWLPGEDRSHLVDPRQGILLADLPLGAENALVAGGDLYTGSGATIQRTDLTQARQAWQAEGMASVLATVGDGVLAVSTAGPLVLLDRASGRERRRYGDWPTIHEHLVLKDLVVVNGQAGPDRSWLAGLNLAGGNVAWSLGLPPGLEILALTDDGLGPAAVVGGKEGAVGVLHLAVDGTLRGLTPLTPGPGLRVIPLPDGALALDDAGVQRIALVPSGASPRAWIPGPTAEEIPGVGSVALQATTGGLRLVWTPTAKALALSLAEAGEPLAAGAVRVEIAADGTLSGSSAGSPWTVAATKDGQRVVIDLLTTRLAGAPLLLRLAPAPDQDPRWWWTQSWRVLAGAR